MDRFEAAKLFGLLSDADQLKIAKMTYNHGVMSLSELAERLSIEESETLTKVTSLIEGDVIKTVDGGYCANIPLLDELMGFLAHRCDGACHCHG